MMANCRFGHKESIRNVLVLHSFADKLDDLFLAIGQTVCDVRFRIVAKHLPLIHQLPDRLAHDRSVKPDLAVVDLFNGFEQYVGRFFF